MRLFKVGKTYWVQFEIASEAKADEFISRILDPVEYSIAELEARHGIIVKGMGHSNFNTEIPKKVDNEVN